MYLEKTKYAIYKTLFYLNSKKIKQSIVLSIALLVSFLINLPRLLSLFDVVEELGASIGQATVKDVFLRFVFLSIFSWLIIQYYLNWKLVFIRQTKFFRILIDILTSVIVYLIVVNTFKFAYVKILGDSLTKLEVSILYFVYFVVLIILVFISGILRYQLIHQEDLVEKELLKQESIKNELEALKNQINPHFLFNSLNSLNSLIRENKQATSFVNSLSFMYRYILQSGTEDLVTIKEELKFLESYIYLINTRYRNRFKIDIDINEELLVEKIPALAMQLLVENAVKHNEISESNPLLVKVYSEDNFIIVENKIKHRMTFVDSTGNGLVNLNKRYNMLVNKSMIISNKDEIFKIKLPLK